MTAAIQFGLHAVQALLEKKPENILTVFIQPGLNNNNKLNQLINLAKKNHISIQKINKDKLDKLTQQGNHQGIAIEFRPAQALNENDLYDQLDHLNKPPLLLILDGVQDPHNLGACLRTADAAGVDAVIAPKDKAVGLTATAHKVACGAAEFVPFVQVTNLARCLTTLKDRGVWLYGAAGEAEQSLYDLDLSGAIGWVLGAEGKGLRRLTREHCDVLVNIPMTGCVSSLNVSVATGVCLFETVRQLN